MPTEKTVLLQSVSPTGERKPVAIYSMTNGKTKRIWGKGSRRSKKKKIKVYKVQTVGGPVWRTEISEGGLATTYDTRGSSGQKPFLIKDPFQIQAAIKGTIGGKPIYSKKLQTYIESIQFQQPSGMDKLTSDYKTAVKISGRHYDSKPKRAARTFYDQATAKAFAKTEYERGLSLYKEGMGWLDMRPRIPRKSAPTQRGAARAGRGAQRAFGLGGRAQRAGLKLQRNYQAYRSAQRQQLERYKKDLESYRQTWGL